MNPLQTIDSYRTAPVGTRKRINDAYELRLRWQQDKPRVYICSPLGAPDAAGIQQNMLAARKYCEVAEQMQSVVAKAPHAWLPEFLDDLNPTERQIGLDVGTAMLKTADAVFICGNRITTGMREEILLAKEQGIALHSFHPEVSKEIASLIGENSKHVFFYPHATSKTHILSEPPEKINLLRLDARELPVQPTSQVVQRSFEKRFSEELRILSDYKEYRNARDYGLGSILRTKDEHMLAVELKISNAAQDAGMNERSIHEHLSAYLDKPSTRRNRNQYEEDAPKQTKSR